MTRMMVIKATEDMGDFPDQEAVLDDGEVGRWAAAMHDIGYGVVEVRPVPEGEARLGASKEEGEIHG